MGRGRNNTGRHSRRHCAPFVTQWRYVPAIHALLTARKTWMPAQASLRSLRKLGCERVHDAERAEASPFEARAQATACAARTSELVNVCGSSGADKNSDLILRRSHALACDRLEGWPRALESPPSFETHCDRQAATAMLLRMRSESSSRSASARRFTNSQGDGLRTQPFASKTARRSERRAVIHVNASVLAERVVARSSLTSPADRAASGT